MPIRISDMRHPCSIGKELSDKLSDSLIRMSILRNAEMEAEVSQHRNALFLHIGGCRLCRAPEVIVPRRKNKALLR